MKSIQSRRAIRHRAVAPARRLGEFLNETQDGARPGLPTVGTVPGAGAIHTPGTDHSAQPDRPGTRTPAPTPMPHLGTHRLAALQWAGPSAGETGALKPDRVACVPDTLAQAF